MFELAFAGLTKLTEEFHLCDPLTVDTVSTYSFGITVNYSSTLKVEHLIEQIKNWLAVLTMYDNSNAVSSPDGSLVEGYCTMLLSEDNRLRGLAKGASKKYIFSPCICRNQALHMQEYFTILLEMERDAGVST